MARTAGVVAEGMPHHITQRKLVPDNVGLEQYEPTSLQGIAIKAKVDGKHHFQDLYRCLNAPFLHACWKDLNKNAASGVDGVTAEAAIGANDLMVAFLTGLMLSSLRKVWSFKETLETMIGSHGKVIPVVQKNILPAQWTSGGARGLCLALVGFFAVLLLERLVSRSVKE